MLAQYNDYNYKRNNIITTITIWRELYVPWKVRAPVGRVQRPKSRGYRNCNINQCQTRCWPLPLWDAMIYVHNVCAKFMNMDSQMCSATWNMTHATWTCSRMCIGVLSLAWAAGGWKSKNQWVGNSKTNPFFTSRPASRVKTDKSQNSENHAETISNVNQGLKAKGRRGNTRLPARRVKLLVFGFPTHWLLDFRPPATHAKLSAPIHILEQVVITKSPSIKFKIWPIRLGKQWQSNMITPGGCRGCRVTCSGGLLPCESVHRPGHLN